MSRQRWDIFCTVVDNYGDVGVCWRLARQLAAEHGLAVRLWVDDIARLHKLCPEVSPVSETQSCRGVEIRHWVQPFPEVQPADVVVEAFACELPETYIKAMARQQPKPIWINLEYLSAEGWVAGYHGGASPHPSLPLTKYFFFPGFSSDTGGLIREAALGERFDAADCWQKCGLPPRLDHELRISLFGYENTALKGLLEAWAQSEIPVTCLVPEDRLLPQIASWLGRDVLRPGYTARRGSLTVRILPFLEQDDYDRLLWASDINFVRGEDSLVRAQWAAKPFVWHIYPQQEGAHWPKLEAFLDLYCAELPPEAAVGLRAFWQAWNQGGDAGKAWPDFWRHRAILEQHARDWAASLAEQEDLASRLFYFCKNKV